MQIGSYGWKSSVLGTALLAAMLLTGNVRAHDEAAADAPRFDHATALAFVDLASLRDSLQNARDAEFYQRWNQQALSILAGGADVDLQRASCGVWVFSGDHALAVLEFSQPLDETDTLAWFGEETVPEEHGDRLYRIPGAGTAIQLFGDHTLVVGDSAEALKPLQHATEQQIAPRRLLAEHGGEKAADAFIAINRPFPFLLPDAEADVVESGDSVLAHVESVQATFNHASGVPLRLVFSTDSGQSASDTARQFADWLGDFHFQYDNSLRQQLLDDDTVPHTARYLGDVDRMLKRILVSSQGNQVEVTVNLPDGLPNFYPMLLHELARASLQAEQRFESVSQQLGEPAELEELQLEIEPAPLAP